MATYIDITDGRIAANKPGETGLMTDIRNDLRYLKAQTDLIGVHSLAGIHDDFTANVFDTVGGTPGGTDYPYSWDVGGTGGSLPALSANPDHYVDFSHTAGTSVAIAASKYRMRFDLDRDHTLYGEFRHKSGQSDNAETWLFGFQDESIAVSGTTSIATQDNIIAFVQDATANKYKARCVKATVGLDVATAQGDASVWNILRIEITFAGATKKVEFFINGTSVGSTTDTAKIPVVRMRPLIGCYNGGGTRHQYCDYADFDWAVRPLSP